jgi:sugar/nucleoside kinase (ribokinase family)
MTNKILICGGCNQDIINKNSLFGGAAGGIALNLSRFIDGVGILSVLGRDDAFSLKYQSEFNKRRIDTSMIEYADVPIPRLTIVNKDNSETAREYLTFGTNQVLEKYQPDPKLLNRFNFLHVENTPKLLADYLASEFKGVISYCPGSFLIRNKATLSIDLLNRAQFIFCNDEEFKALKEYNLEELFSGNLKLIVHTQGEKGLDLITKDKTTHFDRIPPASLDIDSTGAGDAIIVGFFKEYLNDRPLEDSIQEGLRLASVVIQHHGVLLPD